MAILVAGGAGYIGSVTVELLRAAGERVVVLDNLVRGHRPSLAADVPFYQGNIGDRALLQRIAAEHQLESCIHFAAVTFVGESVINPGWYYENNVEQGIALMSALVEAGVRRVVFSSTAATYGDPQHVPISETEPQWPVNPYGWSKLFIERLLHSFDVAYGLEIRFAALFQRRRRHGKVRRAPRSGVPSDPDVFWRRRCKNRRKSRCSEIIIPRRMARRFETTFT